ncbi:hypothetical protein Acr_24g0016200 [Actinidia rufa]|uniref:Non-haem dioxygenase N-terminal domain-containing protein n=1 Tax=Actinidia rufa TaxID=165716 RepID=A0A7J0GX57_9ERIC|nr:hypothetical protein Acr_24g0016200 [Actinidia rufa]
MTVMVQQLLIHGISEAIEEMKKEIGEFFKLSLEAKMTCAQLPNNIEGYGQAFVVSEDQNLDWGDMLFLLPMLISQRNMRFWPTAPTAFRLLRLMAKNLQIDPDALSSLFEDCIQGIRMNHYPPCEHASKAMGLHRILIKKSHNLIINNAS